jgi:hypothetical protein
MRIPPLVMRLAAATAHLRRASWLPVWVERSGWRRGAADLKDNLALDDNEISAKLRFKPTRAIRPQNQKFH